MHVGDFTDLPQAYSRVLRELYYARGHMSRAGNTREIIPASFTLTHPWKNRVLHPERQFNPSYAAGELLWYLAYEDSGDQIVSYAPSYKRFLEEEGHANGAYGMRWKRHDQLNVVLRLLTDKPETRQAVLTMFRSRDLRDSLEQTRDIPCTLSIQLLVRERQLSMVVSMRSNDAWLGLPNDVWTFTTLQLLLARYLGTQVGTYTHTAGSMHLYERNFDSANKVWASHPRSLSPNYPNTVGPNIVSQFESDRIAATMAERSFRKTKDLDIHAQCEMIGVEFGHGTESIWAQLLALALMNFIHRTSSAEMECVRKLLPVGLYLQAAACEPKGVRQ